MNLPENYNKSISMWWLTFRDIVVLLVAIISIVIGVLVFGTTFILYTAGLLIVYLICKLFCIWRRCMLMTKNIDEALKNGDDYE